MSVQNVTGGSVPWSSASKWILGGVAAVVVMVSVAIANFVGEAVWEKITDQIVSEVKAQTQVEINKRIDGIEEKAARVEAEVKFLGTTQQTLVVKTGDLKTAVDANTAISNKIFEMLQPRRPPQ